MRGGDEVLAHRVRRAAWSGPGRSGRGARAGKKVSAPTSTTTPTSSTTNVGRVGAQRAEARRARPLAQRSEPATASTTMIGTKRANSIVRPPRRSANVMPKAPTLPGVGLDVARVAGERRAVVVGLRGVGVERLREALRAARRRSTALRTSWRSPARSATSTISGVKSVPMRDELDLARLDLLAEVLRRAADHQAADEDGEQDEQQHRVQARCRPRRRSTSPSTGSTNGTSAADARERLDARR